ncbi:YkoP family protein [Rubeoparvulum massiliense]|uniref:YkoP family protein n=1 Tax=Rubeoparvulum massiliense TaxID=1631346 RepID=UPI00065E7304|nr:hypothetical protein [Rubeoparvulum massiliense]
MKRLILSIWYTIDIFYYACTRLTYIDKHQNIFRVVIKRYRGRSLIFADDQMIRSGDWICKIHLHNYYLARELQEARSEVEVAIRVLRLIRQSLPGLAQFIATHPKHEEIIGIFGTTKLTRSSDKLGFRSIKVPNSIYFRYKNYLLTFLYYLMHFYTVPGQKGQLQHPMKYLFMPSMELYERYLEEGMTHVKGKA